MMLALLFFGCLALLAGAVALLGLWIFLVPAAGAALLLFLAPRSPGRTFLGRGARDGHAEIEAGLRARSRGHLRLVSSRD